MHPFQLSYYNAMIGGLAGAEHLGLELTYWGDSIDGVLLKETSQRVPTGGQVALAPSLHHLYPTAQLTSDLFDRQIQIVAEQNLDETPWMLVFRRSAYWTPEVRAAVDRGHPVAERSRSGVWLSRLYRLDDRD